MNEIKCPYDLNQFLLGDPIFENTFPKEECEKRKFYGDCYHCFATAIASRDHKLKYEMIDKIRAEIEKDAFDDVSGSKFIFVNRINQIIDKYKESEE